MDSETTGTKPRDTIKPPKPRKASKGIATRARNGKKIRRAKPGGKGALASKKIYVMVVRVPAKVHEKMWRKVLMLKKKDRGASLNGLVLGLIERGVK